MFYTMFAAKTLAKMSSVFAALKLCRKGANRSF